MVEEMKMSEREKLIDDKSSSGDHYENFNCWRVCSHFITQINYSLSLFLSRALREQSTHEQQQQRYNFHHESHKMPFFLP
jgi:hypothetical protein